VATVARINDGGLDRRKKKAVNANVVVARELAGWRWLPATLEQRATRPTSRCPTSIAG
jgi:hypothetical protein